MVELANLQVVVGIDSTAAERGLDALGTKVGGVGSAIQTALGAAAVGAVVGLGAAFVGTVKIAADFEKGLSAISAVSGATKEELEGIRQTALQLGKDTSFSAVEAAAGMEEMIKAGVSLTDTMNGGARAALDLAAAGGTSVPEAAAIMSNAMNTFRDDMLSAAETANIITGAANASAISVHDFGFSLSAVGAVAAQIGLPLKDTAVAIAILGQNGLKGADAGTSLKAMFNGLIPTTKSQIKAFTDLGLMTTDLSKGMAGLEAMGLKPQEASFKGVYESMYKYLGIGSDATKWTTAQAKAFQELNLKIGLTSSSFFDSQGAVKGTADMADILNKALAGLSEEQQLVALRTMFGTDGQRAASLMMKEGRAGVEAMTEAMAKQGDARRIADERLNNLSGSIEKLKGSLETGAVIFGSMFTPALKGMADTITNEVNAGIEVLEQIPDVIGTIKQVLAGEWAPDDSIRTFTNTVGQTAIVLRDQFGPAITVVSTFITGTLLPAFEGTAAPIAAALAAFLAVIAAAGVLSAAVTAVAVVLGFLLSPLGLVALAAAALAAAWVTDFGGIQAKTAEVWAALEPIFMAIVDWLGQKIPPVLEWISTTGWPALVTAGQAVATFVTGTLIPGITSLIEWLGPKLVTVVEWMSGTGWPALVTAGEAVYAMVEQVIKFFTALFVELEKRGVFTELQTMWDTATRVGGLFAELVGKLAAVLGELFVGVGMWVADMGIALLSWLTNVNLKAEGMGGVVKIAADALQGFFQMIGSQLKLLETFLGYLSRLSEFKMPSFNFSAPGGGGTGATNLSGGAGANPEVLRWSKEIALAAASQNISASDLAGLVDLESSGNPRARSGAGAMGLGQVMPFHFKPGEDPYDPQTNLNVAARVYRENLNKYGGDTVRAAAGYFGAGDNLNASDGNATGNDYIRIFQERRRQYQEQPSTAGDMQRMPLGMGMTGGPPGSDPSHWPPMIQEVIDVAPDWQTAMAEIKRSGVEAFTGVGTGGAVAADYLISATSDGLGNVTRLYTDGTGAIMRTVVDAGGNLVSSWTGTMTQIDAGTTAGTDYMVSATTDALGNVTRHYAGATGEITRTVYDAAGNLVGTWGTIGADTVTATATMATGVVANTNLMSNGALASVTNLGTGILTSVTDSAGTTIATVTDMQGQVTSQYATLANGAVLTMGDMAAGVLTSTTSLGDGVMTTVQDMSGNYITTITDLSGNVTSQYTQLGSEVAATTATMSTDVTAETAAMSTGVTAETAGMNTGVVADVTAMAVGSEAAAVLMAQEIIAEAQLMARDTGIAANTMVSDVGVALEGLDVPVTVATELMQSVGDVEIEAPDVNDVIDAMKDVQKAAEKAAAAIRKVSSGDKSGGNKNTNPNRDDYYNEERAAGGWTTPGARTLVGERGPEVISTARPMYVTPNHQLGMGGGGDTYVIEVNVNGSLLANRRDIEEAVIIGLQSAQRRGRTS